MSSLSFSSELSFCCPLIRGRPPSPSHRSITTIATKGRITLASDQCKHCSKEPPCFSTIWAVSINSTNVTYVIWWRLYCKKTRSHFRNIAANHCSFRMQRSVLIGRSVIHQEYTIGQHPVPLYESEAYVSVLAWLERVIHRGHILGVEQVHHREQSCRY
jgi:hypothetical protein